MELYILRHGLAESNSVSGRDSDRRLTPEGAEQVRRQMTRAREMGVSPEAIFSSPYVRALETARIVAELLGYQSEIVKTSALEPDAPPGAVWEDVWQEVRGFSKQVMLVSHEPLVSATVAWMTGVSREAQFSTAALARLDIEPVTPVPRAHLRWIVRP